MPLHPDVVTAAKLTGDLLDPDLKTLHESMHLDSRTVPMIQLLRNSKPTGKTSDGYHTFDELYDHRIALYIALCAELWRSEVQRHDVWRSEYHSDGTRYEGWFLLGIGKKKGEQITYHLPMKLWDKVDFAETLNVAPEFDGHTSADVLERISQLLH